MSDTIYYGAIFKSQRAYSPLSTLFICRMVWLVLSQTKALVDLMCPCIFIYKGIIGQLPSISSDLCLSKSSAVTVFTPLDVISLSAMKERTEIGKKAFKYVAPHYCNQLQRDLKIVKMVSLNSFEGWLKNKRTET